MIRLSAFIAAEHCGKLIMWFDYELGEKNHMSGFVCDEYRGSTRLEKLAQPQTAKAVV